MTDVDIAPLSVFLCGNQPFGHTVAPSVPTCPPHQRRSPYRPTSWLKSAPCAATGLPLRPHRGTAIISGFNGSLLTGPHHSPCCDPVLSVSPGNTGPHPLPNSKIPIASVLPQHPVTPTPTTVTPTPTPVSPDAPATTPHHTASTHDFDVNRHYLDLDPVKLKVMDPHLFLTEPDDCVGAQQIIASAKLVLAGILSRCDDYSNATLDPLRWSPGWITPLHRCF